MSRSPSNPNLSRLCQTAIGWDGKRFHAQVADLAGLCDCSVRNIHRYTTGRREFPRVEASLAHVFRLSIKALRRRLGLPLKTKPAKKEERP